jgi:hypothetical protein
VAAERQKITDRWPALYVIAILERPDRDRPRTFVKAIWMVVGETSQSCGIITVVLSARSTHTTTLVGRHCGYNTCTIAIVK